MSGPNTNYDPVQVSALDEASVFDMRDAALAAINAAIDLAGLKEVRSSHVGDRSPLALANREIGALPPQARKDAGSRVGRARAAVAQAFEARQAVLEDEAQETIKPALLREAGRGKLGGSLHAGERGHAHGGLKSAAFAKQAHGLEQEQLRGSGRSLSPSKQINEVPAFAGPDRNGG